MAKCATLVGHYPARQCKHIDAHASNEAVHPYGGPYEAGIEAHRRRTPSHGHPAPALAKRPMPSFATRSQPDEKAQRLRHAPRLRSKHVVHRALGALQRHVLRGDDAIPGFD